MNPLRNGLHLGKAPAKHDPRDLLLEDYVLKSPSGALPTPPPTVHGFMNYVPPANWGMLGNGPDDTVAPGFAGAGDCFFAGSAHETEGWNSLRGQHTVFTGANVISDYSAATGYRIGDQSSDQGTECRAGYGYRLSTGLVDNTGQRHKLGAYTAVSLDHLKLALYLFDAVGLGIEFPDSAMDQFDRNKEWKPTHGASVEGGHYIPLVGIEDRHGTDTFYVVTWGRLQPVSKSFLAKYMDEAYALLSPEMLDAAGTSITGLNIDQLKADLAQV